MSVYNGKLLELLSVEQRAEKYVLRVRLFFQRPFEFFWEIDDDTAAHIQKIVENKEPFKYRISFQSTWDHYKSQYVSFITRTYRDQSDRIFFPCSEEFAKGLGILKKMEPLQEINEFPFLFREETIIETEKTEKPEEPPSQSNHRYTWITATVIACLFIGSFFIVYLKDSFKNESPYTSVVEAKTVEQEEYAVSMDGKEKIAETGDPSTQTYESSIPENYQSSNQANTNEEPAIPFIEVDEVLTYSIPEGRVALTFDDGPSRYSQEIIDILKQYQAGGTFFFTGLNVKKYPDYVQYVYDNGYSIGSHSMSHANFTTLSYEEQERELLQSAGLIESIIHDDVVLFRPPYGAKNETTLKIAERTNHKLVLWNKDTEDWKHQNAEEIFQYVAESDTSGAIILLHESQAVIDALPRIIEYLQKQGLDIVGLK
ncbi:polysaccharide deacetylase family protein [Bacillus litorisediminis]|uniref:polysaccharide deacetylase family protein n=1 Tax=Bacillus litorisediminis TaxID=2922713 RepID=UPI001FAC9778|nr:polysaccharide deacetylase family protein [Bacillus litorisediminis]